MHFNYFLLSAAVFFLSGLATLTLDASVGALEIVDVLNVPKIDWRGDVNILDMPEIYRCSLPPPPSQDEPYSRSRPFDHVAHRSSSFRRRFLHTFR